MGTAVDEGLDRWAEQRDLAEARFTLLDVEEHTWRPDSSPAALLRADFGMVPFHGRTRELENLTSWCDRGEDEDRPVAVRLYTAPGGFGKTRLLRHFARERRERGWDAGLLPEGKLEKHEQGTAALFEDLQRPLLLVLDYAASRGEETEAVVSAALDSLRKRVRLVLLARSEGDWWMELQRAGNGVGDFFQGPAVEGPVRLLPLTDSPETRQESYDKAVRAFAEKLGKPVPEAATKTGLSFDEEDFERVLLIHAAALAAVEGEEVPSGELLDWLLRREERGLDRARERLAGLGLELQRAMVHGAALLTLAQGADSRAETVEILGRVPSLTDQPRAMLEQIAEALHVLYRGRRWCDGVEPDLVGEHLVHRELSEAPELLAGAFGEEVSEALVERGLTVLNQLAQRRPDARDLLRQVLDGRLDRLALPTLRVAVATGDPIGPVLAQVLAEMGDVQVARRLAGHIPTRTTALRETASEVYKLLIRELKQKDLKELPVDQMRDLAGWSNNLSTRLADLGQWEKALAASEDVVEIWRRLSKARPKRFRSALAIGLYTLSLRLSGVGRHKDALIAIEESVQIYGELLEWGQEAFSSSRAMALSHLSNCLGNLGRHDEGLTAVKDSLEIYRSLSESQPNTFRPDLAGGLNNLSNRLAALGRLDEALVAIKNSVEIYRSLSESRPDAFLPSLGIVLRNVACFQAQSGRWEDALTAIEESVALNGALSESRPDAFYPELALGLKDLGICLANLGRWEEAQAVVGDSLEIFQILSESHPAVFFPLLARGLGAFHFILMRTGRETEALAAIREALDVLEPYFRNSPVAHASLMQQVANDYEQAAEACGVPPDVERLRSIRELVATVGRQDQN